MFKNPLTSTNNSVWLLSKSEEEFLFQTEANFIILEIAATF